jgi:hypothetical protein
MEVSLPTTITFEVYIDPDRCGKSLVCTDRPMGVFQGKRWRGLPVEQSSLLLLVSSAIESCQQHAISTRWIVRA